MNKYQLDIELFQGYMCPGIPVTEDLSFEVEFSDEEELFNLWEEWERDQFNSCDVAWALARYPDLPDHMDLEDDQNYICFIPDEFKS